MAQNWWEQDEVVDQPAAAPVTPVATMPAGPTVVGTPRPEKPKDPPSGFRWSANGNLEAIPGGPGDKSVTGTAGDPKLQEAERTAAFLATRLAGSMGQIAAARKANPNAARPGLVNEGVRKVLGQSAANYITGPERQQIEAAQADALDAALTLGTGAAYTKEQLEGYRQAYFPQLGDDDSTISAKERRFKLLLQSAKLKAGNAAPKVDEALAAGGFGEASLEDEIESALTLPGLSPQDRLAIANQIAAQNNSEIDQKAATEAASQGRAQVVNDGPSVLQQAGNSLANVGAGVVEGIAALPDYAAWSAGQLMALPADLLGFDDAAEQLRNPPQIGRAVEGAVPVPQDWNGWLARQASRLEGGVIGLPARATNALTESLVGRVPPPPPRGGALSSNPQVMNDARTLGIEPTMAAVGGPVTRTATALAAKTLGGARPTVQGAQRMVDQGAGALSRIAGREGDALTAEAMGERATSGALKFRDASRADAAKLYDRATAVAGDAKVIPETAIKTLDEHIAHYDAIPGGGEGAAYLKGLRDELVAKFPDGVTVAGVRGMRSTLRQFMKGELRGSDLERRAGQVIDSMSDDLAASLDSVGRGEAGVLFRQADQAWKARIQKLDEVIMPIIGKRGEKSGEQVAQALAAATRGNGRRFQTFVDSLPANEAGDIRATILEGLGKAGPGAQNAEGSAFSFNTLLTSWSKVGPTARKALFSEGDRKAMEQLARVASRVKDAEKYTNFSNTGSSVLNTAGLASGWANPVLPILYAGGSYAAGKVLASPGGG